MLRKIDRYWHTLRYLRFEQIYGRIKRQFIHPHPDLSDAPSTCHVIGLLPQGAQKQSSLIAPTTFRFLGIEGSLSEVGWDGVAREKLWRYNQHYFDDLNALDHQLRTPWHQALIDEWLKANPPGVGTGWEPFPTSLRIVNWIKWSLSGGKLTSQAAHSLAIQTRWLTQTLETHLLGNHLFTNAKALVFAGLFFEGIEAKSWLKIGMGILEKQIPEQILADGGHFERSPMYHALALEDILDLCNILMFYETGGEQTNHSLTDQYKNCAKKMFGWLNHMSHPDGDISFFNDAAIGIAPSYTELTQFADRLGLKIDPAIQSCLFNTSGYARLQIGASVALLDLAPIGPDYLPAHAHADTLSFEWSLFGHRILVNSGTSVYGDSFERLRQRSTAAHNTVVINNQNSSEVWGGFRVARRAHPQAVSVDISKNLCKAQGTHDGYQRLHRSLKHTRKWLLTDNNFVIEDFIEGRFNTAEARFHFAPGLKVTLNPDQASGFVQLPDNRTLTWRVMGGFCRLEQTTWHPAFGVTLENVCVCLAFQTPAASFEISWCN